jgi:hypothetical protein
MNRYNTGETIPVHDMDQEDLVSVRFRVTWASITFSESITMCKFRSGQDIGTLTECEPMQGMQS